MAPDFPAQARALHTSHSSMAVVIRMKRTGRRNRPCYRISVADSRSPRDGRVLETIGLYDPVAPDAEKQVTVNVERAQAWLRQGAKPSETVHSIFKKHEIYTGDLERKPRPSRKRTGRKVETAARKARTAAKTERAERKSKRQADRVAAKRAAAKAAAGDE